MVVFQWSCHVCIFRAPKSAPLAPGCASHKNTDTICDRPTLFHGDTALCRCAVYLKQHIGTVDNRRPVISNSAHFRCHVVLDETCLQHGTLQGSFWSSFCVTRYIFAKICAKTIFTFHFFIFSPQWSRSLTFLALALTVFPVSSLLTRITSPLSSNGIWYSVFGNAMLWISAANVPSCSCWVAGWVSVCHVLVLCRNGSLRGHICYGMRIGNYTDAFEWYHFQWPWVTSESDP